jgi:hypothetical protein
LVFTLFLAMVCFDSTIGFLDWWNTGASGVSSWWSLGFEASGDEADEATMRARLLLLVKHVLAADKPPAFDAKAPFGYPKWLEIKARRGRR